jgi:hypothetical protein
VVIAADPEMDAPISTTAAARILLLMSSPF